MPTLVKLVGLGLLLAVTVLSIAGVIWNRENAAPVGGAVILSLCAASGLIGLWVLGRAKSETS